MLWEEYKFVQAKDSVTMYQLQGHVELWRNCGGIVEELWRNWRRMQFPLSYADPLPAARLA